MYLSKTTVIGNINSTKAHEYRLQNTTGARGKIRISSFGSKKN
jgi:hypothetical protein